MCSDLLGSQHWRTAAVGLSGVIAVRAQSLVQVDLPAPVLWFADAHPATRKLPNAVTKSRGLDADARLS
jgi:hypothetical protein